MTKINVKVSSQNSISVSPKSPGSVLVNQSKLVSRSLGDLADVNLSGKTDGSLLIYDEGQGKFVASTLLDKQEINGGHF
jgi:hypothetical protein